MRSLLYLAAVAALFLAVRPASVGTMRNLMYLAAAAALCLAVRPAAAK